MCSRFGVISLITTPLKAEAVIKVDTLSFEKCLDVIATTSTQIAIEPRVSADRKNLKIVEYDLVDGIWLILCDGKKQCVRVSSKD